MKPRGISMNSKTNTILQMLAIFVLSVGWAVKARTEDSLPTPSRQEKVIIDTDIGDDIDDAFALALALRSPQLQILGVTTTFGDTNTRAKLVDRFLAEAGRGDIPVAAGVPTPPKTTLTQRDYAEGGHFAKASHRAAVDFMLDEIRRYPGEITLIGIGPLMNVGALIDKDPQTFRKLKRVVIMGGSIKRGYDASAYSPSHTPDAEWNIVNDIPSAKKLFLSGVPIYMLPLDSTQLKLDETKRAFIFRQGTPITKTLATLYYQWGQETPTLFDPMALAYILNPGLCPVQPVHIRVDDEGFTRAEPGAPNAQVCLHSDSETFFRFYLGRLAGSDGKR
jgi:purine nucleosidase